MREEERGGVGEEERGGVGEIDGGGERERAERGEVGVRYATRALKSWPRVGRRWEGSHDFSAKGHDWCAGEGGTFGRVRAARTSPPPSRASGAERL